MSNCVEDVERSEGAGHVSGVAADVINKAIFVGGLLGTVLISAIIGITAIVGNTHAIAGVVVGTMITGLAIIGVAAGTAIGKVIIRATTMIGVTITGSTAANIIIVGVAIISGEAAAIIGASYIVDASGGVIGSAASNGINHAGRA